MKMCIPNAMFAITSGCNLNCTYCYIDKDYKKQDGLYLDTFKQFVDKLVEEEYYVRNLVFHGVEPTMLSGETYSEMIKYYRSKIKDETAFFMQTNGVKMDSIFENLTPYDISIGFSIDGCEELHDKYRGKGNFQKTLNNIHTAVRLGFTVTTLGVFTAESIFYSSKIILFANQMKAMGVPFSLKTVHTDDENLSLSNDMGYEIGREIGKNGLYKHTQFTIVNICSSKGNECEYYQFSIDGKVYSCNKTFKQGGEFANWKEENFFDIVQRRKEVFNKPLHEDCDQCEHYWMCNGGCPADRVDGKSLECYVKRGFFDWAVEQKILPHTLFRSFTRKI